MIADLLIAVALALAIVVATVWPELVCNDGRERRLAMTGFTMSLRLCDDHGMVSEELIPDHPQGYTYRNLHNHLAGMTGHPPVAEDFACTGSAHLAHEHIRCTSPAHGLPNHYCSRMRDGRCAVCGRHMGTTGEAPSSLAGMRESVVVNPSAIGDPAEDPVVFVGADLRALLNPCACGGVNGFHAEGCQVTA